MSTESIVDVGRLRSELSAVSVQAERAFERAFDLQQAGAAAQRVDAVMADVKRLQDRERELRARLGQQTLH